MERLCTIEECNKYGRYNELCYMHHNRIIKTGSPHLKTNLCTVDGCPERIKALGLCVKHCTRYYRKGSTANFNLPKCQHEGCERKPKKQRKCFEHYYLDNPEIYSTMRYRNGTKLRHRFNCGIRGAKSKNHEWEITFEQYEQLMKENCYYCEGDTLSLGYNLDRTNNDMDYTISNVVPCCSLCNQIKSNIFNFEEFKEFAKSDLYMRMRKRLISKKL